MDSHEAFVALNLIEGVGPVRVRSLVEHFGDAPAVLSASKSQLLQVRSIGDETATAISNWEKTIDLAGEMKRLADSGCRVLIQSDDEYPASLREIYDPPMVLYIKGALSPKDKNSVALVGSRQTTHYGIETARKLAYQLAYIGVTVVSGGARGIDTAAHQGALAAKGRTVCVLGTGISIVLPVPTNRNVTVTGTGSGINALFPFPIDLNFRSVKSYLN
jgi:DNA processing protein